MVEILDERIRRHGLEPDVHLGDAWRGHIDPSHEMASPIQASSESLAEGALTSMAMVNLVASGMSGETLHPAAAAVNPCADTSHNCSFTAVLRVLLAAPHRPTAPSEQPHQASGPRPG